MLIYGMLFTVIRIGLAWILYSIGFIWWEVGCIPYRLFKFKDGPMYSVIHYRPYNFFMLLSYDVQGKESGGPWKRS